MKPMIRFKYPNLFVVVIMVLFVSPSFGKSEQDLIKSDLILPIDAGVTRADNNSLWMTRLDPIYTSYADRQSFRSETPLFSFSSHEYEMRNIDELDDELQQDPDVNALINIREEMTARVVAMNVSPIALKLAYQNGDKGVIAGLLGYSEADLKDLASRLDAARTAILQRYPEIAQLAKATPTGNCGLSPSSGNCNSDLFFDHFAIYSDVSLRPVTCRWAPYIAGLIGCSAAGPIFYWPCAYAVLCSFCAGGWVDSACG